MLASGLILLQNRQHICKIILKTDRPTDRPTDLAIEAPSRSLKSIFIPTSETEAKMFLRSKMFLRPKMFLGPNLCPTLSFLQTQNLSLIHLKLEP